MCANVTETVKIKYTENTLNNNLVPIESFMCIGDVYESITVPYFIFLGITGKTIVEEVQEVVSDVVGLDDKCETLQLNYFNGKFSWGEGGVIGPGVVARDTWLCGDVSNIVSSYN